jgi:hypothetical protein
VAQAKFSQNAWEFAGNSPGKDHNKGPLLLQAGVEGLWQLLSIFQKKKKLKLLSPLH